MRRRDKQTDRLGLALIVGALIGFVIGAVDGFSSSALDAPVVLPFLGAAIGVLVAGVGAAVVAFASGRDRVRREAEATERALGRARLRDEAHEGWIEGIDLTADAPPRPPRLPPRRRARRDP